MAVKCGIVGLPGVGKSVLFNAMTKGDAASGNFLFCTTSAETGVVNVPDARLGELAKVVNPAKITHATQEFVDLPGLVRGSRRARAWATPSSRTSGTWMPSCRWSAASRTRTCPTSKAT